MNRRKFIGTSVAASIAAVCAERAGPAKTASAAEHTGEEATKSVHRIERIGLQLYTVRGTMKTDFEGTIAKVAATGYKEVEFAGYFEHSPKEIRSILDKHGLNSPSGHVDYTAVEKKWPETLEAGQVIGHSYVICPSVDEKQRAEPDGWKRAAELFNKAGEVSKTAGIQFAYHNHSFEFEAAESLGGKLPYDFLLAETDPKLVVMEMDLCWISVPGKDPLAYFHQYPGRFHLVHVKDWVRDARVSNGYEGAMDPTVKYKGHMADVGQGSINWKRIFAQSGKAGIKHYYVENDEPKSAFHDIQVCYRFLRDLRF